MRGATTALTRRTVLRKAFLAPWHPLVQQCWLYAMALAQKKYDVALHHALLIITHYHLSATPASDNLPAFVRFVHREMSCALNTLLAHERYDQPGELWDGRKTHYMRLCDAPAQAAHLVYEYMNCVAAGLVRRPEHMPGHTFDFNLWKTGVVTVKRPDVYFSRRNPEEIDLVVTPPPLLYAQFRGDMDKLVHHMGLLANETGHALRAQQRGPVLGSQRIQRIHPWDEPRTTREARNHRVPSFRIGARGVAGVEAHIQAATETTSFRNSHHEVRLARKDGDFAREFPYGTYLMRVQHNAPVAPPPLPGETIVTAPGPLLCEIQAELERERAMDNGGQTDPDAEPEADGAEPQAGNLSEFLQDVRGALLDEAEDLHGDATDELGDFDRSSYAPRQAAGQPPGVVVVRHRFDSKRLPGEQRPKRIVTHRDRRRGRPAAGHRHGADPPD